MVARSHSQTIPFRAALAASLALALLLAIPVHPQLPSGWPPAMPKALAAAMPKAKPDAKSAKEEYKAGLRAESAQDWEAAYEAYSEASKLMPGNKEYVLRRQIAKSRLVQERVNQAERDAVSGRLAAARAELLAASHLDPSNTVAAERLAELSALESAESSHVVRDIELSGVVHLEHQSGKRNFDYRGDTKGAYEEIARQFGVEATFEADLRSRPVRLRINDLDFSTAMMLVGNMTGTFWRPLTKHLFFVAENTLQERKDYEGSAVCTILLPASETDDQMKELQRVVREVTGITRSYLDTRSRTFNLRASPHDIAIAADLIDDLERPLGELILEIEVLEVDRNYARQLGLTPPETGQVYPVSSLMAQQAQSLTGLVTVLEQIFGTPSSLSGLTPTQIAAELASGQISPAIFGAAVLFGGGNTRFLATLPGTEANFAEMLSLVRQGQRILLRAKDGQPATFFVGERFPVSLGQYSSSLGSTTGSIVTSSNLQITDLATGNSPAFVTAGNLRNQGIQDLIVSNFADNTVSVFLGNGDGTFATQTTYATGAGPTWIATGDFNNDGNLDLVVADKTANTISILLGNGDGTFKPKTDLKTGTVPVSVVAANLHDLNGKGNLDLIVANQHDATLSIFQGNGDGTFQAPTLLKTGGGPTAIAAADFNADGHIDLAVVNQTDSTVSIFLGNGDGTFQPRTDYATGNSPVWVSAADYNGDNILDLAVANNSDNTVSILLGNSNAKGNAAGTFGTRTDYSAGAGPTSIAVADYSQDGILDLAVTDATDNAISLLFGQTGGTFAQNYEIAVGTDPLSIVTADFNADGRPDVAVANNGSNSVSVILNEESTSNLTSAAALQPLGAEYVDIGVKVKATPRIHQDNEVTLQLHLDISSLSTQSYNGIPVINNESIEQTVRLKENETSALAGILQPQVTSLTSGTPGLAGLPGFGLLAGNQSVQAQDTELLILVTPRTVSLSPRKNHAIYVGRGAPQGPGGISPVREERRIAPLPEQQFEPQPQPEPQQQP
jgi:hypothetical protein